MTKTLQQIGEEVKADDQLDEVIKIFWDEYQEDLKKTKKAFIEEATIAEPDWVKDRKLEWLNKELTELNLLYIKKFNEANKYENKILYKEGMGDKQASLCYVYKLEAERLRTCHPGNKGGFMPFRRHPWRGFWRTKDLSMKELEKEIRSVNIQINLWENPEKLYAVGWDQLTDDDIQMAREADASTFIEVKRQDRGRAWAICPFHSDTRPSLCIYEDTKQYHCFVCNEHGNTIDLVMKLHDVNFKIAVKTILFNL